MKKEIALVDCNNFFASCEQLKNPELLGKPVCVLSNNDGCVIARSAEAKKLGIKMGLPHFMASKQFPQAVYLSSDFAFYHDISIRIRTLLMNYSPSVEVYSIDEAFLDLTGIDKIFGLSYEDLIIKIQKDIRDNVGINTSVGLANSKILAKSATEIAKHGDFTFRISDKNLKEVLRNIPIEDIWGVGRNISAALKKYGIFKALDVLKYDDDFYKKLLGKRGLELRHELMGESVISVLEAEKPKSIQKTRSFPKFTSDKEIIKMYLYEHLHSACAKMRRNNLAAMTICVMLRTKDFRVFVERKELVKPEYSEFSLHKVVDELFNKMYNPQIIYRSAGIFTANMVDTTIKQMYLFTSAQDIKAEKIAQIWDKIDAKFGKDIFSVGFVGKNRKKL